MSDDIHINYDALDTLKSEFLAVAGQLSDVANGAYVTANMFAQSRSAAARQLSELLSVLASSASTLLETCRKLAAYCDIIKASFKAWEAEHTLMKDERCWAQPPNQNPPLQSKERTPPKLHGPIWI